MGRLLGRAGLLLLPFVVFLVWFEVARGTRATNGYIYKHGLLAAAAPRVEVLFLGSSHANVGIKPLSATPGGFNLASPSQSIYYDIGLVRRYLDDLPALRLVVFSVSYFSLGYEVDQGTESWRTYYYSRFHQIFQRDHHRVLEARNFSSWFLFGRQFGLAALRGSQPASVAGDYDPAGGTVAPDPLEEPSASGQLNLETLAQTALARHHSGWDGLTVTENQHRLAASLRLLQRRGIQVVFLTLPVSAPYRAGELPERLATNRAVLTELGRELNAPWFDYSADPRFTDADFRDGDHLNHAAGEKFSRFLGREVVAPLLARAPPGITPVGGSAPRQ